MIHYVYFLACLTFLVGHPVIIANIFKSAYQLCVHI